MVLTLDLHNPAALREGKWLRQFHPRQFLRAEHIPHMGRHQRVLTGRNLGMLRRMHVHIPAVCHIHLTSMVSEHRVFPDRFIRIHYAGKRLSFHVLRYFHSKKF